MFIFRILFGLVGLAATILLLPLRLLGPALSLTSAPVVLILHFLSRYLFFIILLVIVIALWIAFRNTKVDTPQLPMTQTTSTPRAANTKGIPIVQPVTKQENGDSDFATDVYATMNDQERISYSRNFYWAMSNLPDTQAHNWNYYNIAGSIRAVDSFANNSGVRCRHFTEVLKVHTVQQTLSGVACEQGSGAWCKLKPNATAACNLGGSGGGFFDSITSSLKNLF